MLTGINYFYFIKNFPIPGKKVHAPVNTDQQLHVARNQHTWHELWSVKSIDLLHAV